MTLPYGSTVLEHFRRPRNQRTLETPSAAREAHNPLCGDRVRLEVDVAGGRIRTAAFTANACAICTASASLLTERVHGLSLTEALGIDDAGVIAALGSAVPESRRSCATLPLRALHDALTDLRPVA